MQVSIKVFLNQEDIDKGLTASDAVYLAFPHAAIVNSITQELKSDPVHVEEASINNEQNDSVDDDGPGLEAEDEFVTTDELAGEDLVNQQIEDRFAPIGAVDSAGVPWNREIHSSNKKFYGENNAEAGRWMWKKGSDKDAREGVAQQLAAATKSEPEPTDEVVSDTAAPADAVPLAAEAVPAVSVAPVVGFPTPENTVAVENSPEENGEVVTPATSEGGITWPNFVKAVTANAISTDQLNEQLAIHNLDQMALLSPGPGPMDNPQRISIATALGFI